jgi:hypothetical protein
MLWWLSLVTALIAGYMGYGTARRFVRDRLRYVDSAQGAGAPLIAGIVAALIVLPIGWLPLIGLVVGGGTALTVGVAVALGVRAGAADVKRGYLVSSGN